MDVKLVVQSGERGGQEVPIDGAEFVIGRDPSCQFQLADPLSGLHHCRILRDGESVTVEDLDSERGTAVNGRFIDTAKLGHGDRLSVGYQSFLIVMVAERGDPTGQDTGNVEGAWAKLRVTESRGIALVSFADIALINDIEIREVDRELGCLIEMGYNRIALNFDNVVHMSSQVIGTVLKTYRKCLTDGGVLKICQIHPNILEIFALTGVYLRVDIFPDTRTVLESDWPKPSRLPSPAPRPAPPPKTGVNGTRPPRGVGKDPGPKPPDPPAAAIPLDDVLDDVFAAPPERAAPAPRPAPVPRPAAPQTNGVETTPGTRSGRGEDRAPPPDGPCAAIEIDDLLPPPAPAPRPAIHLNNGVVVTQGHDGPGRAPRPTHPVPLGDASRLDDVSAPPSRVAPVPRLSPAPVPEEVPTNGVHVAPPWRVEEAETHSTPTVTPHDRTTALSAGPGQAGPRVRLIALLGRAQGQIITIPAPRFLIGRDPCCHLRAISPTVRRIQAIIEQRGGRVYLRDVGCSGDTAVNDRPLADEEIEVADGDRLQIGPMRFTCTIEPGATPAPTTLAVPPPRPDPTPLATSNALADDPHLRPLLQCPQCGTEGWMTIDQLLPHLLLAIGRALSPPQAGSGPSPLQSAAPTGYAPHPAGPAADGQPSLPPPRMDHSPCNGHVRADARPATSIAPPGHAVSHAATADEAITNGRVLGGPGVSWASAVPPALPSNGNGTHPPRSAPGRLLLSSPVEIPIFLPEPVGTSPPAGPEIEAVEDPSAVLGSDTSVLDLLPFDAPDVPAQQRDSRNIPVAKSQRLALDFVCPKCGTEGWIPVDRLDRQFQCKNCNALLYTDVSGGLLIGDLSQLPQPSPDFVPLERDLLDRTIDRWKALPRLVRIAVAVAASCLLVALVRWVAAAPELPPTLRERGMFVGEAFANEDYRRLRAITAPGGADDLSRWMDQVRPRFYRGRIRRVWVKVDIQQQDKKAGKATMLAHVIAVSDTPGFDPLKRPPAVTLETPTGRGARTPAPATSKDNRQIDLKLLWVRNDQGQWLLDAPRTCAAAKPLSRTIDRVPRPAPRVGAE